MQLLLLYIMTEILFAKDTDQSTNRGSQMYISVQKQTTVIGPSLLLRLFML